MNSLMGYGSDDDPDDSPDTRQRDPGPITRNYRKPGGNHNEDDTNYDEVQMSLSEDSDSDSKHQPKSSRERVDDRRSSPKLRDGRNDRGRERREDRRGERRDERERHSSKERSEERARYRDDEKPNYRDVKEEDRGRSNRDEDRTRDRGDRFREREDDKLRDRRDDRRGKSRESYSSRDDRYRKDRDRRRSRSPRDGRERERRRSRSPRRNERSRSRSRDRNLNRGRGGGAFGRRYDKGLNRLDRLDKMACASTNSEEGSAETDSTQNKDRFFVPGITGRFREQIEKRKLLWQKKEPEKQETVAKTYPSFGVGESKTTKVWEATTFAQDTDGKVANKFKRLMGIKSASDGSKAASEVLKKQEEMFSSMEQQYEVARTATHTMRGVGLGFGSYPR
ncbi:hypothetical protein JTB14_018920 [Gonioctena quinquepunctata]|nr:hypothetical protein JTB14_018920 [Gonioctena quinquepunctata]